MYKQWLSDVVNQ